MFLLSIPFFGGSEVVPSKSLKNPRRRTIAFLLTTSEDTHSFLPEYTSTVEVRIRMCLMLIPQATLSLDARSTCGPLCSTPLLLLAFGACLLVGSSNWPCFVLQPKLCLQNRCLYLTDKTLNREAEETQKADSVAINVHISHEAI